MAIGHWEFWGRLDPDVQALRKVTCSGDALVEICRRYEVRELALFGSVLRDDFRSESDVDVLYEIEPGAPMGLIRLGGLKEELEALFGRSVDLVPKKGLKPAIRQSVLDSAEVVYAAA